MMMHESSGAALLQTTFGCQSFFANAMLRANGGCRGLKDAAHTELQRCNTGSQIDEELASTAATSLGANI